MIFKLSKKRELTIEEKRRFFYIFLFAVGVLVFYIAAMINTIINDLTSQHIVVVSGLEIPKLGVLIAPVVEECLKMFGYAIIFLLPRSYSQKLGYNSKSEFINNYIVIAFLFSVGLFGVLEGMGKNIFFCPICFLSFVFLQSLIHITYSLYPFILGRRYRNWFVCFLPIAILLHAIHNFIIEVFYDNKWVTFAMVMIFLVPFILLEWKNISSFCKKHITAMFNFLKKSRFKKHILLLLFILMLVYIFLCCLLAF